MPALAHSRLQRAGLKGCVIDLADIRKNPGWVSIIGAVLLILSGSASAGPFIGINYGPFHESGQQPGTPIPDSQFISDLGILSQKFTFIKTYGDDSTSRLDRIVPIAAVRFK